MASRFIPNTTASLLTLDNTGDLLQAALRDIVTNHPPKKAYPEETLHGLWAGPTGISYLFLHISAYNPRLIVEGHAPLEWAREYLKGSRGELVMKTPRCGFNCEKTSFEAVRAAVTKDLGHVQEFLSNINQVINLDFPDEMLYGRAGVLYMLRMIRHWVPNSAPLVERAIVMLTEKIMSNMENWRWHGKRYFGAVHGDIGIVTQLVLTTPPLAPQLRSKLEELLSTQLPDGNWPSSDGTDDPPLVQFCYGVPGFLFSLFSLRVFYPDLEGKIEAAIQKGRECVWDKGILRKEPSICHGLLGNAL
jgi:lantibiotic modifying enzyme